MLFGPSSLHYRFGTRLSGRGHHQTLTDEAGYRGLVVRYLGRARLAVGLTVQAIAARVLGMTPANLEALVTAMKRSAMRRMGSGEGELPPLTVEDVEETLARFGA